MALDAFSYKFKFLQDNLSQAFLFELESKASEFFSRATAGIQVPDYLRNSLLVDILYACVKHHLWINHSFFIASLTQHIMESYRMEREVCSNVIHNLRHYLGQISPPPDFADLKDDDASFISYIFIMTLSIKSDRQMLEEIGLGSAIFKKISAAIKSHSTVQAGPEQRHLALSDADMVFHQVIADISMRRAQMPWYLESSRLRYLLAKAPQPFAGIIWEQGTLPVEALLLNLGQGLVTKYQECSEFLKSQVVSEFAFDPQENQLSQFLKYLESCGLLEFTYYSPVNCLASNNRNLLTLSQLGYELTAGYFASISAEETVIPKLLLSLNASWQLAILTKHKALLQDTRILGQLLALPLAAESIEFLMSYVDRDFLATEEAFFARELMTSFSLARRLAFCRGIAQVGGSDLVVKLLVQVAESDCAGELRSMALIHLHRMEGLSKQVFAAPSALNAQADLGFLA